MAAVYKTIHNTVKCPEKSNKNIFIAWYMKLLINHTVLTNL